MAATRDAAAAAAASASQTPAAPPAWLGAATPRGYGNITDQVDLSRCELLNVDSASAGSVRVLFETSAPTALQTGATADASRKDWVESDVDEQLMLFAPFHAALKLHTLQITSFPSGDAARPQLIKLFSNTPHNLGFDEAEDTQSTQEFELAESDWNARGTATVPLRYVKFQNVNSLVVFVVSAQGGAEKVRLDRIRLFGEKGEKREIGKLEKIGDELGE